MRTEYKVSRKTLSGRACVEHRFNSDDLKLFGHSGFIWLCRNGRYAATITSARLINKRFADRDFKYETGRDKTVYFDAKDLAVMCRLLRVPADAEEQVFLAEANEASSGVQRSPASA